ncbi:GNAT family N-acetyltransferase [Bdellovibrio sp. HCB288]|uniref:GNAT family N-acetyltransferase n=1 Tax=Bdellovibrio sp. HCB288 TaxID=3394355 RepID=UPI0039B3A3E2
MIKLSGELIGYGGFKETYTASDKIDFMYAIMGKFFGKGLGTQIVGDLLAKFKELRSEKKITSVVNPENIASIKILEKYNFSFQGFATGELNHLYLYEL